MHFYMSVITIFDMVEIILLCAGSNSALQWHQTVIERILKIGEFVTPSVPSLRRTGVGPAISCSAARWDRHGCLQHGGCRLYVVLRRISPTFPAVCGTRSWFQPDNSTACRLPRRTGKCQQTLTQLFYLHSLDSDELATGSWRVFCQFITSVSALTLLVGSSVKG